MKAYCINLDQRPDRREHVWSQFERLGVEVERVAAVDGSLPEVAEKMATLKPGMDGACLSAGAYACFQSHRLCWQKLVESGAPYAMILEDDPLIADGFGDFLADGWVPADADIVKMETCLIKIHLDRKRIPMSRGRYLAGLRSTHYGTACYVISRAAAERLLQLTNTFSDPGDVVLFNVRHKVFATLSVYQMDPAPVTQGCRVLDGKGGQTWSHSSIYLSFAPGEFPETAKATFAQRIRYRLRDETRALLQGTRYTFVRHE